MAEESVLTMKELSKRVGVSEGQLRQLVRDQRLRCFKIGSRIYIPPGAWEEFLATQTEAPRCPDAEKDPACDSSIAGAATTLSGPSGDARASARRAQQTFEKLKSLSKRSSTGAPAP
ncbi:MAG: helix-turn-helix domain-containing protein [Pseudomonadota bacterium]